MKYLKTYKIFESNFYFKDELEDILLELSDNGLYFDMEETNYSMSFAGYSKSTIKALAISIWSKGDSQIFRWSDIKDVVERIEEYCFRKGSGYSIDVEVTKEGQYLSLENFIESYDGEEFSYPGISLLIYSDDDYEELLKLSESINVESDINIWEFDQMLGSWVRDDKRLSFEEMKKFTNHFVGDGFYERIDDHMTRAYKALEKIDIDNINDRFLELWDDVSSDDNWILPCISYGNYEKIDNPEYSGSMPIGVLNDDNRKKSIMSEIIRAILRPTLNIGYSQYNVYVRNTKEELFVTDDKYQCINFDFSNYSYFRGFEGDKLLWKKDAKDNKYDSGNDEDTIIELSSYQWKKYEKYSPENVLSMYVPCIYINIGENGKKLGMILSDLESRLDDIVDAILPGIDYKDVIWDMSRGVRKFSPHRDAHEYTLKIILNF